MSDDLFTISMGFRFNRSIADVRYGSTRCSSKNLYGENVIEAWLNFRRLPGV